MPESRRDISIVGPEELSAAHITRPKLFAAGLPAVKVAIGHALKEMGVSRSFKTLAKLNQKEGIDCPGCAWPDPAKRSSLGEFCENGVKAISEEATQLRVTPAFFAKHSVEELSNWSDYEIGKSGRITHPMVLRPDRLHYEPISWEAAFDLIGQSLRALPDPDQAIFYTSGRSSNEAAFLYGLFVRTYGTNNMPDCSNMCHESSGVALGETLGIGKGSVTLEDFGHAEVIIVMGQNPGTNHPRMLSALAKCKHNGGAIVTINPLEEAGLVRFKNPQQVGGIVGEGTLLTDHFLQVKINQDVALLKYIMKRLAEIDKEKGDVFDHAFIEQKTQGFYTLLDHLAQEDEQVLLNACGVDQARIENVVQLLAKKQHIIICWAMGLTQHKNAVDNIKECVNLLLLKGSIGKRGAGTCPVRGHSNVQGDRTVGINHYPKPELNKSFAEVFNFQPPDKPGFDVVKSIQAMHEGRARLFIALGGNFLSAASDTVYTGQALQNCDLTVSISTKLNRTHLVPGKTSLILPTLGRTEKDVHGGQQRYVTVENSMGRVHRSQGRLEPVSGEVISEPEIVAGIAHAYHGSDSQIDWLKMGHDYGLIREGISAVIAGFDNYSEKSASSGFDLPNNARKAEFDKLPGGRAQFSICKRAEHAIQLDEFLMMTIRTHDQFNTTIYGMDDRYRGIYNERRVIFINADDLRDHGLKADDCVDIVSRYEGVERKARNFRLVPYNIPRGNIATYFPEANPVIPIDQYADKSGTPISKSVIVKLCER